MSNPTIVTRISRLLSHWPSDPVRPASVSVQTYLQSRLSQAQGPTTTSQIQSQNQQQPEQNAQVMSEVSLNALSSLLEDRFARRYPLAPRLRRPASNPDHYDNVVREFEEAPDRDWMGRLRKKVTGLFRLS